MTAASRPEPLFTGRFGALLAVGLANFLALGVVAPLLPRYIENDLGGGSMLIGVLIALYAVSAVAVRPWAAGYANRAGRRPLVIAGAAVTAVSLLGYAVSVNLSTLMAARLLTGVGQAMFFTGAATLVTEFAPKARMGEALSYFSVAVYLGTGAGPAFGELAYQHLSVSAGFFAAAALSALSLLLALRLQEPSRSTTAEDDEIEAERVAAAPGVRTRRFAPVAIGPGAVLALGMIGSIAFGAYMPLYSDELGMSGSQWVYLSYAGVIIAVRVFGAKLPDRLGAGRAGTAATTTIAAGMGLIAAIATPGGLYLGAIVFALGTSFHYPSLMALVVSRAPERERSSVVATFTAFFDIAAGFGGLTIGVVATLGGYRSAFAAASICALAALWVLRAIVVRRVPSPAPARVVLTCDA